MFVWFHTTLLSHGLTGCLVSPACQPIMPTFHSASYCFDFPLRYQALMSGAPLGAPEGNYLCCQKSFPVIPGSTIRWGFLKVSCCLDQCQPLFPSPKQAPSTAFSQGCCQETRAFVTFLDVFVLFSDLDYDLCFCFDLCFYFFFQQSTIPIQQVSSKTFVLMLWM